MGELADGNPMFPGENEIDQLDCIIKVLGNLPQDLVDMFYDNPLYNGKELLKVSRPESLERRYMGKLGPTAIDFLKGLLILDPNKRLNDDTVFKHNYFANFMKEPENKYILDLYERKNNTISNPRTSSNNLKNHIKKEESNTEMDQKNTIQTKVINNTTNINIINYNNYNNNNNNKNNVDNENENDSLAKIVKEEKLNMKDSKKSISNDNNNNTKNDNSKKSNQNILEENNTSTKKSLSVNKINNKGTNQNTNMQIYSNNNKIKLISLSQGKTKKNNNINNNHNNSNSNSNNKNITQNSFNIQKINIYGSNYMANNSNNNIKNINNNYNNEMMFFANTNIDGYKTFFNINKSKDKYNFKINQGYIKEEGKKYANQNINMNDNVIDENEEYIDFSQKKKSVSKEHKKNGQLLIKYTDNFKYNFNNFNNKNGGYGTFYKYNMKNTNFGGFNKKKNSTHLPQLFKINSNNNHKNKFNNKNKFKYY